MQPLLQLCSGVAPGFKESLPVLLCLVCPTAREQNVPGGGLGVTQPQPPVIPAGPDEWVVIQGTADHFGHGVTLLIVELFQEAEHATGNARLVSVDQVTKEQATSIGRVNVPGGSTTRVLQRGPKLASFRGTRQREHSEKVDQMAVSGLVVRDVAGCRGCNLHNVPGVQPSVLGPIKWSVEFVHDVLSKFVFLLQVSPDDHKFPQFSAT